MITVLIVGGILDLIHKCDTSVSYVTEQASYRHGKAPGQISRCSGFHSDPVQAAKTGVPPKFGLVGVRASLSAKGRQNLRTYGRTVYYSHDKTARRTRYIYNRAFCTRSSRLPDAGLPDQTSWRTSCIESNRVGGGGLALTKILTIMTL